ncbi:MAG: alpha-2-macroglobulin family protein [Verrucomicrobiales bacterium]
MKRSIFALAALGTLLLGPLTGHAQETPEPASAKPALTFQRFPYRFDSQNPLRPDSAMLLQFNVPVGPADVERSLRLYDKPNTRFAALSASRPSEDEVKRLKGIESVDADLEKFVLIQPASNLPLGGTWYLKTRAGLASLDGLHEIARNRLDYVGRLDAFTVTDVSARVDYDSPLEIAVVHNKARLDSAFDGEKLAEYISVSPEPNGFAITAGPNRITLSGDFDYGTAYRVTVSKGIAAGDTTRLDREISEEVTFEPNEGFVSFPAFTVTQNSGGHRKFDVKSGNLTGTRTRVKRLEGDELIQALGEYDEKYEGWGGEQTLPITMIPGDIVYDEFQESTSGVDETETVELDWDELADNAATGAFYLCSEGSSATREGRAVGAQALVQLTDIGMAWKQSGDGTLIQTFSLKSGKPLAGLTVRLLDDDANTLADAVTGEDGLASIAGEHYAGKEEERFYLDARHEGDRHVIRFNDNLASVGLWSFSIPQRYDGTSDAERRTLVFTDRNVYKPGDDVKVKIISRFVDEDELLGPGAGQATLRLFDARRRKLAERTVELSENGSFDDEFELSPAGLGWHSIEVDFNQLEEGEHRDWRLIATHSFRVEEYRVNTFEVDLTAQDDYAVDDLLKIPVSASYYMGKPLSKAELNWSADARTSYPRPRGFDEFSFGDSTADYDYFSTHGTEPLSSKGRATVEFDLPDQGAAPAPRRVTVRAQVTDANQQTITNSAEFTVHSSDFYLGLRKPDGVHRAGDTATFSLAAVTSDGTAHTEPVETTLLVEKEIWNTVKVMGANGRMTHRNERSLRTVSEVTTTLETRVDSDTGLTRAMPHDIAFEEAGDFLVTATARDDRGRPVVTRSRFAVIGAEEPSWSWHDVIRIDLVPDKPGYEVGDTAKLLVRSPVFGSALLTTERGGVRSSRSLTIDRHETVLEIPIEEGDAPNLFASVLIVRGSDDSPHVHRSPDYRLGYCQLKVDDPATHLTVAIDAGDAEYYQPGEQVELTATVTDFENLPVADAEVTFFAVDEGVLSLTGHRTPDPNEVFQAAFPLAVFTGESLGDLLPENPLEQDFTNKGYVIGGGMGKGMDPDRVRKDFKALAFWQPALQTGEDGVVSAVFEVPDNLTTFRIMAVVAQGNRFGNGEEPIVVNKPLVIEPALPGFTNLTDQIDVSAVLHNNTGNAQEVEIEVELDEHAVFLGRLGENVPTALTSGNRETTRTVKAVLDAGATETFAFPVALTRVGEAKWNWKVRSLTETRLRDATESTVQVGYPLPLLRESRTFTLEGGESLENALAAVAPRLLDGRGDVEVTLSNSRLVEASDALDYLLAYPYGCVEQTTSTLLPWLSTQSLRKVMPDLDKSEAEVRAVVENSIARLFSMQTSDGGLGYWPGATKSMLTGSAYGGMAVALAAQQGIEIPEEPSGRLWDYLSKSLRNSAKLKNPYELSQRCLAAYTLALAGVNETSYHEVLFEKRGELSGEARSLLALAMVEGGTDAPKRIETLLSPDENVPVAEGSWYRQPYVAATRLLAQVRHDPGSERVDALVDDLMKLRRPQRGWGSTYSNAWPLIALAAYGEAAAATLSPNEITIAFGDRTEQVALPAEPGSGEVAFRFDGDVKSQALAIAPSGTGPVYASVRVATRPELIPMEPEQNGFSIARRYEKVEADGSIGTAEDLRVGDLILVTLDLNIPNERETYLAIDDPLPAIFEAVNPDFESQATQKVDKDRDRRTFFANHRELRKDRVLFFADSVFRPGDYAIQYLARVVAPGEVTAPPAKIEAMYEPQRFGLSGTEHISAAARDLRPDKVAAR